MDEDFVKQRNLSIKQYLDDTEKSLKTNRDILVVQIIQTSEEENEYPKLINLCGLYDMEEEDVIRVLEKEHDDLQVRLRIAEYEHNKKGQFDW